MDINRQLLYILVHRNGDHCNRLFQSLHYHAFCLHNGYLFFNPTLVGLLNNRGLSVDRIGDIINNIFNRFIQLLPPACSSVIYKIILRRCLRVELVGGWSYRCYELTSKYRDRLSSIYRFHHPLTHQQKFLLAKLDAVRRNGSILLGVHIRRGDYSSWQGGIYYYCDDTYREIIASLRLVFSSLGKDIYIIVTTNEITIPPCGQDMTCQELWYVDQLCLQHCDYLIGPPSTFTMWASYVASIPYYHITNPDDPISLDQFCVCPG